MQILVKVKKFAIDHDIIVKYQELKRSIRLAKEEYKENKSFIFAFKSEHSLSEHLKRYLELQSAFMNDTFEEIEEKVYTKLEEANSKLEEKLEDLKKK